MNDSIWFVAPVTFLEMNIIKDESYKNKKQKKILRLLDHITMLHVFDKKLE